MKTSTGRALLVVLLLAAAMLSGCATPTVGPTPTPTRTPRPTATNTPVPTPTPAFPVTVACAAGTPAGACARLRDAVALDTTHFAWGSPESADVLLGPEPLPGAELVGTWTYAVAVPFFTVEDDATTAGLQLAWTGTPTGTFAARPLLVSAGALPVFTRLWGPPDPHTVGVITATDLLSTAEGLDGWALLPFHQLQPEWKVLRVDGIQLLEKGLPPGSYPLEVPLYLGSATRPETLAMLSYAETAFTNRDEAAMTVVVMTGVTAMTRGTAQLMEAKGVTYPAQDVKPWFEDADFVHVSNEVSFKPDCVAEPSGTMSFCSHDSYIGLMEEINTNVVELTGNHLEDKGTDWVDHSLEMYRERGWQWFGGGANQAEGQAPLLVEHGPNQIAFIGCNTVGPFAGEESGGAARCDFDYVRGEIARLRDAGYQPIVTLQYLEDYNYFPTAPQIRDFRSLASAGAVMVQGSQAHQAQTMEFYDGAFVHYGLGNFFFDQMWSDGTRQEFVDRLTFYEGRLLGVDLRPAILEEYGRPRPMTVGDPDPAADRAHFLEMIFSLSPQE